MQTAVPNRRSDGLYEVFRENPGTGVFERCRHKGGCVVRKFATEAEARAWIARGTPDDGPFILDVVED